MTDVVIKRGARPTPGQLEAVMARVKSGKADSGFLMDDETFEREFGSRTPVPRREFSSEEHAILRRLGEAAERRGLIFKPPYGSLY